MADPLRAALGGFAGALIVGGAIAGAEHHWHAAHPVGTGSVMLLTFGAIILGALVSSR